MTLEKIEHLKSFFDSLEVEIGYPCIHRELKNYINDDTLRTWADVFKRYIDFPIVYPDFNIDENSHCDSNDEKNEHESEEQFLDEDDDEYGDTSENKETKDDNQLNINHSDFDDDVDNESVIEMHYVVKKRGTDKRSKLPDSWEQLSSNQQQFFKTIKITAFTTWMKYKKIVLPYFSLQILKEDMCDTCFKFNLMLQDDKLTEAEKEDLRSALSVSKCSNSISLFYNCYTNNFECYRYI